MSKRYPNQVSYPSDSTCWEDAHGVVHFVGVHSDMSVRAECGCMIARSKDNAIHTSRQDLYRTTDKSPTCIACVSVWSGG